MVIGQKTKMVKLFINQSLKYQVLKKVHMPLNMTSVSYTHLEVLHIISAHLMRVKALSQGFHKTAVHMAMDMVVNDYLEHVDRDAVTVANVNARFGLLLKRFRTIESVSYTHLS